MSISKSMARVRSATLLGSLDRSQESLESREDSVRKDLTRRLKCACNHLSSADFDTLVGDMTREQLRGERIPGRKIHH